MEFWFYISALVTLIFSSLLVDNFYFYKLYLICNEQLNSEMNYSDEFINYLFNTDNKDKILRRHTRVKRTNSIYITVNLLSLTFCIMTSIILDEVTYKTLMITIVIQLLFFLIVTYDKYISYKEIVNIMNDITLQLSVVKEEERLNLLRGIIFIGIIIVAIVVTIITEVLELELSYKNIIGACFIILFGVVGLITKSIFIGRAFIKTNLYIAVNVIIIAGGIYLIFISEWFQSILSIA